MIVEKCDLWFLWPKYQSEDGILYLAHVKPNSEPLRKWTDQYYVKEIVLLSLIVAVIYLYYFVFSR